jgi:hypothetical protein
VTGLTAATGPAAPPRLTLLTRPDCELCEQLLIDLEALRARHPLPALELADVDGDPQWQRRWGMKIPVLLLDGAPVCQGALDSAKLLQLLRL